MAYIRVWIDSEDCVDDLSTEELAKELVKRKDWRSQIDLALKKPDYEAPDIIKQIGDLVTNYRMGRPIDNALRDIAWEHLGRSI